MMKREVKALALALLITATTACGSKDVQVESTPVAAEEASATKVNKVASISTPKATNIKKEEVKANYLIPQTRELADEEVIEEVEVEANEETEANEILEVNEEVEANENVEELVVEEIVEEVIEQPVVEEEIIEDEIEEVYLAEKVEEPVYEEIQQEAVEYASEAEAYEVAEEDTEEVNEEAVAFNYEDIYSVSRTSESISLPNKVEEKVYSPAAVIVEETPEVGEKVASTEAGLTVKSPSVEEVRSYWTNYVSNAANKADFYGLKLVNQDDIYEVNPVTNANHIDLGQISMAAQEDALHIANTVRFASGLNEISLGADQIAYAQAATMVNRLNLAVSHNPAKPVGLNQEIFAQGSHGAANSNLAASFGILDSVVEYIKDDIGSTNQQEVGHRRWVLNPSATAVGFGQTDEFNAMYVNNDDYANQNSEEVVAYPGQTAISEFHSESASLSLQFGESFDLSNASVAVTDLATGAVSTESHVDQSFKGNGYSITFGNGMNYAPGTKLEVKVAGVTKNGVDYPVEYTIEYMSLAR